MFLEMKVSQLAIDPITELPIILLKDLNDENPVPIWVGLMEASVVATELDKVRIDRPITHDLILNILDQLAVKILGVEITDLQDNTYYGALIIKQGDQEIRVEARPSDAIILALKRGCAIRVDQQVIEKAREIDLRLSTVDPSTADPGKIKEFLAKLPEENFGKWKM